MCVCVALSLRAKTSSASFVFSPFAVDSFDPTLLPPVSSPSLFFTYDTRYIGAKMASKAPQIYLCGRIRRVSDAGASHFTSRYISDARTHICASHQIHWKICWMDCRVMKKCKGHDARKLNTQWCDKINMIRNSKNFLKYNSSEKYLLQNWR